MKEIFGLYVILTDPVAGYRRCTEAAVAEGIRFLQLRMKECPRDEVVRIAQEIREITRGSPTRFVVNDDPLIAAEVDADGVHLGQEDMPVSRARDIWNTPGKIFGLSTHNEEQEQEARELEPDYIGVGPVFPTPTKARPDPVLGLDRMRRIIRESPFTAVAIGGINNENLVEVLSRGAVNFSAVRPIMQSNNPRAAIARLMDTWRDYRENT